METTKSDGVVRDVSSLTWIHWAGVGLSIGIAVINILLGYTESQAPFFIIGSSFLLGVVLFMTRFWKPVLYLLGVLHVGTLGVIWFLNGMEFLIAGVAVGVLSSGLAVIATYLFLEEGP